MSACVQTVIGRLLAPVLMVGVLVAAPAAAAAQAQPDTAVADAQEQEHSLGGEANLTA